MAIKIPKFRVCFSFPGASIYLNVEALNKEEAVAAVMSSIPDEGSFEIHERCETYDFAFTFNGPKGFTLLRDYVTVTEFDDSTNMAHLNGSIQTLSERKASLEASQGRG